MMKDMDAQIADIKRKQLGKQNMPMKKYKTKKKKR